MEAKLALGGFVIFAALFWAPAASAIVASDYPLRPPFDVEAIRAAKGKPVTVEACPEPVPAISDIEGVSFYGDPQGSKPDSAKLAANNVATRPLDFFLAGVVPAANRWVHSRPAQPEAGKNRAGVLPRCWLRASPSRAWNPADRRRRTRLPAD